MEQTTVILNEIKIVGLSVRTNNASILSGNPVNLDIMGLIQKYFQEKISDSIQNRLNPGVTYCLYSDYESDYRGDYTYYIGEEVSCVGILAAPSTSLIIPTQTYMKFTNDPGPMPTVCLKMWENIWSMTDKELQGKRAYKTDFEIYDHRAADPSNTVLDIFIGLNS